MPGPLSSALLLHSSIKIIPKPAWLMLKLTSKPQTKLMVLLASQYFHYTIKPKWHEKQSLCRALVEVLPLLSVWATSGECDQLTGYSDGRRGRWVWVIRGCFGGSVLHFCKMIIRQIFFLFFIKNEWLFSPKLCKMTSYWDFTERFQIELDSSFRVLDRKKGNCLGAKKTPNGQKAPRGTGTCNNPLLIYLCYHPPCPSLSPRLPACPLSGSLFLHPASHRVPRGDAEICSLIMTELWKHLYTLRMKEFCCLKIPLESKN